MKDQIKEIIAEVLDVEVSEVKEDAKIIDDLGADSIAVMEIVMEIEGEFDVEIDTKDIPNFQTINDIVAFLDK